jgi:pyruvate dehydrogenase complex dehydrogenase (E1) component
LLRDDWGVVADVWSATSFTLLHRDGESALRWNLLHPGEQARRAYVAEQLDGHDGPVVAATDYVKTFAEQIRPFVGRRFHALGTDGFGRSDTRKKLRDFFEVDRRWIALAALHALADEGAIDRAKAADAIARYGIDPNKPDGADRSDGPRSRRLQRRPGDRGAREAGRRREERRPAGHARIRQSDDGGSGIRVGDDRRRQGEDR